MCKYKTKPVVIDADQFICEIGKEPTFIPKGAYEKTWTTNSSTIPFMKQWGVDGRLGFTIIKNGDWVVKHPDEKWLRVYSSEDFEDKYESLAFPLAWER